MRYTCPVDQQFYFLGILLPSDKDRYFPQAPQVGEELEGLLALVQSLVEGPHGAERPLELASRDEYLPLRSPTHSKPFYWATFRVMPVVTVTGVSIRNGMSWSPLDPNLYVVEPVVGHLLTDNPASEVLVQYQSGFDFGNATPDTVRIKSIAGEVVEHFGRNVVGRSSNTSNPAGAAFETYNLVAIDKYLTTMLLPLKQYAPRAGGIA